MSKIYEALRRAELERAEKNGSPAPSPEQENGHPAASFVSLREEQRSRVKPAASVIEPEELARLEEFATPVANVEQVARVQTSGAVPRRKADELSEYVWHPSQEQLPALEERGSAVEQFRSLRSRMHEFRDLNPLKSLAISSALPQEGKSFVAANLAIAFARHKASRVLLIDGDMRRSSLHKMLGCPNTPGLTEYLAGKNTLREVMQRARHATTDVPLPGLNSLTFIPGGGDADNAADLSGNSRFAELIRGVSPDFDWIVLDTPPVNLVADGVNLARVCDGTLLIARAGVTKYEAAQRALSELKASRVLGFVLNAVVKPPITGGYYGYDTYDSYDRKEE